MHWIPSHIHKETNGIFHGFKITHIEYPKFIYTILISETKLFPHILNRGNIKPLRVTRRAHVIYMVIHPPSARMFTLLGIRQTPHITPIIISKKHDYIIRHTKPFIIIILHLFIKCPYLGSLFSWASCFISNNTALIFDDTF